MEAQFLTVQLNLYYGEADDQRLDILKVFNESPSDFQHTLVLDQLKRMRTDYPHLFPELKWISNSISHPHLSKFNKSKIHSNSKALFLRLVVSSKLSSK